LFEQIKMEGKLLCVRAITQEYEIYRTFTSAGGIATDKHCGLKPSGPPFFDLSQTLIAGRA